MTLQPSAKNALDTIRMHEYVLLKGNGWYIVRPSGEHIQMSTQACRWLLANGYLHCTLRQAGRYEPVQAKAGLIEQMTDMLRGVFVEGRT